MSVSANTLSLILVGFVGLPAAVGAIFWMTAAARGANNHRPRLADYLADTGWRPDTGPAPPPVEEAVRSPCTKLALVKDFGGREVWMVWHEWTETYGETFAYRAQTSFFVRLGPGHPDVEVKRRTGIGGLMKAVRGPGTGDAAFDRDYYIAAGADASGLVGPPVRELMLARRLPAWRIDRGVLSIETGRRPDLEIVQPMADQVIHLAHLLG